MQAWNEAFQCLQVERKKNISTQRINSKYWLQCGTRIYETITWNLNSNAGKCNSIWQRHWRNNSEVCSPLLEDGVLIRPGTWHWIAQGKATFHFRLSARLFFSEIYFNLGRASTQEKLCPEEGGGSDKTSDEALKAFYFQQSTYHTLRNKHTSCPVFISQGFKDSPLCLLLGHHNSKGSKWRAFPGHATIITHH